MKRTSWKHLGFTLLVISYLLSACGGQKDGTANVTLVTGLEKSPVQNFMEKFSVPLVSPHVTTGTLCNQTQLYAGWGLSDSTGDSNSNALHTYPISIQTPVIPAGATVESTYGSIISWLQASNLQTVSVPAPVGIPVDFGILGALVASPVAGADGTCVQTTAPSYSIIGHAQATISGATTLPVNIWTLNSNSAPLYIPTMQGQDCSQTNQNAVQSQVCPNLNFSEFYVSGSGVITNHLLLLEYFFDLNDSTKHVKQFIPIPTSGVVKAFIPGIDPVVATLVDAATKTPLERVTFVRNDNNNSTASVSPTPFYFQMLGTNAATDDFLTVSDNGGVTPPGSFALTQMNLIPGGFTLNWNYSSAAQTYTLGWASSSMNGGGYTFTPWASNVASGYSVSGSPLQIGYPIYVRVQASSGGPSPTIQFSSNEIAYHPFQYVPSSSGSAGSGTISWVSAPAGATLDHYIIRYGLVSATTGQYPNGYTGQITVPSGGAISYSVSGLTPSTPYHFVVEAYNGSSLVSISQVGTGTF